jgi:transcription elongation factor Elf1
MACPVCGGERIVRAAVPGEQPGALLVCLQCAALWEGTADED